MSADKCGHPTKEHGYLGCDICGCPRSEEGIAGDVCRYPEPEDWSLLVGGALQRWDDTNPRVRQVQQLLTPEEQQRLEDRAQEHFRRERENRAHAYPTMNPPTERPPWTWVPGAHADRFPHGLAFEPVMPEPDLELHLNASLAQILGNVHANEGHLWTLDSGGARVGEPIRLLGPFTMRYEEVITDGKQGAKLVEFTALGGVLFDPYGPRCVEARGLTLTPYREDGTLGESVHLPDARVEVCFTPPEIDQGMRRALANLGPTLQAIGKLFVDICQPISQATFNLLTGIHPYKRGAQQLPPVAGLTRRQRAAQRHRKRRRS